MGETVETAADTGATPLAGQASKYKALPSSQAPGHTDLMVTPESIGPWLEQVEAAKIICDFMGWCEDGAAWDDANKARSVDPPRPLPRLATD
jgi:hypothetical protein